jgi:hypothetical protein
VPPSPSTTPPELLPDPLPDDALPELLPDEALPELLPDDALPELLPDPPDPLPAFPELLPLPPPLPLPLPPPSSSPVPAPLLPVPDEPHRAVASVRTVMEKARRMDRWFMGSSPHCKRDAEGGPTARRFASGRMGGGFSKALDVDVRQGRTWAVRSI